MKYNNIVILYDDKMNYTVTYTSQVMLEMVVLFQPELFNLCNYCWTESD